MAVPLETRCRGTRCTASLVLSILGCLLDPHRRPSIVSIRAQADQINESQSTVALYSPLPLAVGVFVFAPAQKLFRVRNPPGPRGERGKGIAAARAPHVVEGFCGKISSLPESGTGVEPRLPSAKPANGCRPARIRTRSIQVCHRLPAVRSAGAFISGSARRNVFPEYPAGMGPRWILAATPNRHRDPWVAPPETPFRLSTFVTSSHRHRLAQPWGQNQIRCFIRSPMPRWIAAWDRGIVLEPR
jgi:hypothetical protein